MRYFGTDGIRGSMDDPGMDIRFLQKFAAGFACLLNTTPREKGELHRLLIARDTRKSGRLIEEWITKIFHAHSIKTIMLGVLPTPALALLVNQFQASGGLMITASHNPANHNGLKCFFQGGRKLSQEEEQFIEALIDKPKAAPTPPKTAIQIQTRAQSTYTKAYASLLPEALDGFHIALDTASGAAYETSPKMLRELKAQVSHIDPAPNGDNINKGFGTEALQALQAAVLEKESHLGIAHDGDADRVRFVNSKGQIMPGEAILGILAIDLHAQGKLKHDTLITTTESNIGLDKSLQNFGIQVQRVPIGDRHISEALQSQNFSLGGESSGHIIFPEHNPTGDGLLGALKMLELLKRRQQSLHELSSSIQLLPEATFNLPVHEKIPLKNCLKLQAAQTQIQDQLGQGGRLQIRYSGTENLLRVRVEAPEHKQCQSALKTLREAAQADLTTPNCPT